MSECFSNNKCTVVELTEPFLFQNYKEFDKVPNCTVISVIQFLKPLKVLS